MWQKTDDSEKQMSGLGGIQLFSFFHCFFNSSQIIITVSEKVDNS